MQTYEQPDKDRAAKKALEAGRALFEAQGSADDETDSVETTAIADIHEPSHPEAYVEEPPTAVDKDSKEISSGEDSESIPRHGQGTCLAL